MQAEPANRSVSSRASIGRVQERPAFDVNASLDEKKPQLIIAPRRTIRFGSSSSPYGDVISSVALLQINEDEQSLLRLRTALEKAGVASCTVGCRRAKAC